MKFEYTGRHIDVTPALRSHVEEHFKRIDHLFNGKPAKAHVIIEVERGRHRSEVIVKWRNDVLTATTKLNDMYQSLSQLEDACRNFFAFLIHHAFAKKAAKFDNTLRSVSVFPIYYAGDSR